MNLVKAYNYLSEERIKLIKEHSEIDRIIEKKDRELTKLKRQKASEYDIESCKKVIEVFSNDAYKIRELLDVYFAAVESIKAMIALKRLCENKQYDVYFELKEILSPALREEIYGEEY